MVDPLIRRDGTPFPAAVLDAAASALDSLSPEDREEFRASNAAAIAALDAARVLLVSGPGTGKSRIFLRRIKHWLTADPDAGVLVTSFVRKLVQDLERDVSQDKDLTDQQKRQITEYTLHRLARSMVEQSHGTSEWRFRSHFKIIAWRHQGPGASDLIFP